jgi:hypothetical protein
MATLLPAAEQVLQQLEEEARASWEDQAVFYATQVTNLAGKAFEALNENRWSRRDCMENQDELDWVMRTFQWICDELDLSDMAAKMRKAARARGDQVNHEHQRAARVVERLLRAHRGRPETGHPTARDGRQDERKHLGEFNTEHTSEGRMEYEDSVPMDRRPTLPVADIPGAVLGERASGCTPLHPTGAVE